MPLARFTVPIVMAFVGWLFNHAAAVAPEDTPPPSCHVTLPSATSTPSYSVPATQIGIGASGAAAAYGSDKLWTMLPMDGTWRGLIPQRAGDFAYSNKLPWDGIFSFNDGPLKVTGKRLDGPALKFTEIEPISGERALVGGISIPVFGCWEITGQYRNQELSFIVWVTPISGQKPSSPQPLLPATAPRRVRVNSEVEVESPVYLVTPELPHEAQVANVSGTVVLHGVMGIDGRLHDLRSVSGPPLLAQAAIGTVTW